MAQFNLIIYSFIVSNMKLIFGLLLNNVLIFPEVFLDLFMLTLLLID